MNDSKIKTLDAVFKLALSKRMKEIQRNKPHLLIKPEKQKRVKQ